MLVTQRLGLGQRLFVVDRPLPVRPVPAASADGRLSRAAQLDRLLQAHLGEQCAEVRAQSSLGGARAADSRRVMKARNVCPVLCTTLPSRLTMNIGTSSAHST